jgi:predicted dehydrogenase
MICQQLSPSCPGNLYSAFMPSHWLCVLPLSDQAISYPFSLNLVIGYLLRYGLKNLLNKLTSRLRDHIVNKEKIHGLCLARKFLGTSELSDQLYLCFVPSVSSLNSIFVLHEYMYIESHPKVLNSLEDAYPMSVLKSLSSYKGWSAYSGANINCDEIRSQLAKLRFSSDLDIKPKSSKVCYQTSIVLNSSPKSCKPQASLFGLGNYSKTIILPYIGNSFRLNSLHEIDGSQISRYWLRRFSNISTFPYPEDVDYESAIWFIASYHHMHADTAIMALKHGITPVIEKPLFTTQDQLSSFRSSLSSVPSSRFFSCFQKRYQAFNQFIHGDLGIHIGDPIHMHASVYEIPLPSLHWYNWPNSRSRVISNGCHWIDYFLFVNGYSRLISYDRITTLSKNEILFVSLENGAECIITITDAGSSRLGVREYIELRSGRSQCTIRDSSSYVSENSTSILRRISVNPLLSHQLMYRSISTRFIRGLPGDPIDSLHSSEVALWLDLSSSVF